MQDRQPGRKRKLPGWVKFSLYFLMFFSACTLGIFGLHDISLDWQAAQAEASGICICAPEWSQGGDSRAYRSTLNELQQETYDIMESAIREMRGSCVVPWGLSMDEAANIFFAVLYDNPDIFWTSTTYACVPTPKGVHSFYFFYLYPTSDVEKIRQDHDAYMSRASEIVEEMETAVEEKSEAHAEKQAKTSASSADDSNINGLPTPYTNADTAVSSGRTWDEEFDYEFERANYLYDLVCETLSYEENRYDQTISGLFDDTHKTVCAGYSRALKLLCDAAGIECVTVQGLLYGDEDAPHLWNMMRIEDRIYYVDATMGDYNEEGKGGRDSYFTTRRSTFQFNEACELAQNLPIYIDGQNVEEPEPDPNSPDAQLILNSIEDFNTFFKFDDVRGQITDLQKRYRKAEVIQKRVAGQVSGFFSGQPEAEPTVEESPDGSYIAYYPYAY